MENNLNKTKDSINMTKNKDKKKIKFETLKGTNDIEPKEMIKINKILDIIRKNYEGNGFRPFDTPIIEYWETLTMKYDDDAEIVEEIFSLSDRGKRKLGLRYDLTTPLSRFVSGKKQLKKPFKRYQIGKNFRDGPIKPGRLREFMQCDGDVIGVKGVEIEAELLELFYRTYQELNINAVLEINNNKILRGALLQQDFKEEDLSGLILSIDKLKKIKEEGVLAEIKQKGFNETKAKKAIKILSSTTFKEIEKQATNETLAEGITELKDLIDLIEGNVQYRINFSLSRGLDIYTGNLWEVYDFDKSISSSIGAGGRFDKVIGEYAGSAEEIPAVGISFGLVPILACIDKNTKEEGKQGLTDILVVPLDKDLTKQAFKIAKQLRKNNVNVEISYDYKLKKAFSYADYLGVEKLAIIGKKDIENNQFTIKNLKTKQEEKIKIE